MASENPLISGQKSSDGLQVALHPLVLLMISDYITRHTLRNEKGPVIGALLGQQNGREITIEHAFDCHVISIDGQFTLHKVAFEERLQQMKDVHKVPALELVGWYTLMPIQGPQPVHLPIHKEILEIYNESAILLGFHPTAVLQHADGKLPLTIYESNWEVDEGNLDAGGDKEMKDSLEPQMVLKFKELPYAIETGEAEMISVDFVARGGGNATAVEVKSSPKEEKGKGKSPTVGSKESTKAEEQSALSREDEEKIAAITAKINAIKMLKSRIDLIIAYLQKLPSGGGTTIKDESSTEPNQQIFRSILALCQRLTLLVPDDTRFAKELISEKNDVGVINLLSVLTGSVNNLREAGRKSKIVDDGKLANNKGPKIASNAPSWDAADDQGISGVGDLHRDL